MENLKKRMETAARALERLHELTCVEELSEVERDAMIQRFEFCFEILWKCSKDYLFAVEGLGSASPKKTIRLLREVGVLDDKETEQALAMADDRNLTVHTYDENMAKTMAQRIRDYEPVMREWYRKIKEKEDEQQ